MHTNFLNTRDMSTAALLADYSFGEKGFFDWFFQQKHNQPENWLGFFDDANSLQAIFCANPYQLHIHAQAVHSAYITTVTTSAEARGCGYFPMFMKDGLQLLADKYPLVFLKPIESKLYSNFGFAFYANHSRYKMNLHELQHFKNDKKVKFSSTSDANALAEVYNICLQDKHGFVVRTPQNWSDLLSVHTAEGGKILLSFVDGKPTGYMLYYIRNFTFEVLEIMYTNTTARNALLANIYRHSTQAQQFYLRTFSDDLLYLDLNITQYAQAAYPMQAPFMMARILDVVATLKLLPPCQHTPLVISLTDRHLPHNNGNFLLNYSTTNPVTRTEQTSDVTMSIEVLTQLFMGYIPCEQALQAELFTLHNPDILHDLRKIFIPKTNYINEEF